VPLLSEPAVAADLARLGFQLMARANNHALDWNLSGMRETSRLLDAAGIVHAGVGERLGEARAARYLETPKGRVGLVSFASSYLPVSEALAEQGASPGRPGVSALKVYPSTIVPPDVMWALASLKPSAASADSQASAKVSGDAAGELPAELRRFGLRFVAGERLGNTYDVDEVNAGEVLRVIRQGKQYSDFLIAALHTHQAEDESVELDEPMLPADFVQAFAHAAIEAGADAFVTTGNHNLGPVEVVRGRPIFYGLGNFIWSDLLEPLSADVSRLRDTREVLARGFAHPELTTDADVNLATTGEWFRHDFTFYSVVTRSVFEGGALREIELHPVWLRHGERLTRSGIPQAAPPDQAARILDFLALASEPYGTRIDVVDGVGHVRAGEPG
jgi:poly-gamma-glutamate synthesis protein (capsule biosynthesis protein)